MRKYTRKKSRQGASPAETFWCSLKMVDDFCGKPLDQGGVGDVNLAVVVGVGAPIGLGIPYLTALILS